MQPATTQNFGKSLAVLAAILGGIYLASYNSYVLFHSLAELFSIIIAFGIFMVAWNSRPLLENNYLLFLGIGYLFIGTIDLVHTLAYKGMGVFPGYGANLPTQLWIIGRYTEAFSVLLAPIFLRKRVRWTFVTAAYFAATVLLLWSVFAGTFPECFIDASGLTTFKIVSEYVICLILAASVMVLLWRAADFDPAVLKLLIASIVSAILGELAFTSYVSVYGPSNMAGHLLKIISYYFVYKAIIETCLVTPYNILFRNLAMSEQALRKARDDLEKRVIERTADLTRSNDALRDEMAERTRATSRLAAIVEYSNDAIIGKNAAGVILSWNAAAERIYGYSEEEVLGRPVWIICPPELAEEERRIIERTSTGERLVNYETIRVRKDGVPINVSLTISPIITGSGENIGISVIARDITRQKHEEARLRAYMARLEWGNRELSDFAFVASHDLQEPLRKIQILGDLLKLRSWDRLGEDARDLLERMRRSAARIQYQIRAIREYSRLKAEPEAFREVNLGDVVRDVVAELKGMADQKGATLEIGDLPTLPANPEQMRQLFTHLIENSLKFNEEERPVVRVAGAPLQTDDQAAKPAWYQISIEDNGLGFDEKYVDRIFRPFQRLHQDSGYEGAGMGLAICRKIAELHGGGITAKSQVQKMSKFIITLPSTPPHRLTI